MADDWRTAVSVLEERMKTMQAEYKTDIARLAEDAARRETGYRTDIARLAEDAAKRETRLIVTLVGLVIGAVAVLGVLIRWPT